MLPFVLTLALDGAPVVMPAAATYHYNAFVSGARAGGSTLIVTKTAAGLKIDEHSNSDTPDAEVATVSSLDVDGTLMPSAYSASYKVRDKALDQQQTMALAVTFAGREATVQAGNDVRTFALGGSSKTFIVMDSSAVSGFFLLPAQMRALNNGDTTALVPGLGSLRFLDVIPGDKPARPADVPAADASLSFAGDAPFIEWYDPTTLVADQINVPGINLVIKRAAR